MTGNQVPPALLTAKVERAFSQTVGSGAGNNHCGLIAVGRLGAQRDRRDQSLNRDCDRLGGCFRSSFSPFTKLTRTFGYG